MLEEIYEKSIILIGPSGAGKSTIANELSKETSIQRICLDIFGNKLQEDKKLMNKFNNWDEFNEYLIWYILEKIERSKEPVICDFGAGHSIYEDPIIFNRIKDVLSPFKNIVLLLPSNDNKYSLKVLNERTNSKNCKKENILFLSSHCNEELATIVTYTDNKSPHQISTEILELVNDLKNVKNL